MYVTCSLVYFLFLPLSFSSFKVYIYTYTHTHTRREGEKEEHDRAEKGIYGESRNELEKEQIRGEEQVREAGKRSGR